MLRRMASQASQSSPTTSHIPLTKEIFVDGWIRSAASACRAKKVITNIWQLQYFHEAKYFGHKQDKTRQNFDITESL
jgi:hypothetical protein